MPATDNKNKKIENSKLFLKYSILNDYNLKLYFSIFLTEFL